MTAHESPSPVRRHTAMERCTSQTQLKGSTASSPPPKQGLKHPLHRAHSASHGRLAHARNTSLGKISNKLKTNSSAVALGEASGTSTAKHRKSTSQESLATAGHIKRNSSNVTLPRVGSKVSIKRNSSNLSLKRNGSTTQVGKTSRPTTPQRKTTLSNGTNPAVKKASEGAQFTLESDDDAHEDEWTEESASQSASTTRHGSTRGHSRAATPPPRPTPLINERSLLQESPPESPVLVEPSDAHPDPPRLEPNQYASRPLDPDAITTRLLTRRSMQNLPPQLTSISALSTPGTSSPPHHQPSITPLIHSTPSLPPNGISRFLSATSSASSAGPLPLISSPPRPSSPTVRKSRSAAPLADPASFHPTVTADLRPASNAAARATPPPEYAFTPSGARRPGGNTQAKLDLWRTQGSLEPSHGPPVPLRGAAEGMLGTEERRVRLWEKAEAELLSLRRFQNPVLESLLRVEAETADEKRKSKTHDTKSGKTTIKPGKSALLSTGKGSDELPRSSTPVLREHDLDRLPGEHRPLSRSGGDRRTVRFETVDEGARVEGGGSDAEDEGNGGLEDLIRRIWEGTTPLHADG